MQTMVTTIVREVFISIIIPNCNFRINYFRMFGPVLNKNVLKKKNGTFFQPCASVSARKSHRPWS